MPKWPETAYKVVNSLKNGLNWVFKKVNGRQSIAFWTNAVNNLRHEMKAVNI
jgi:hypothetical protein